MKILRLSALAAALQLSALAIPAAAQDDDALYDPAPPPGAAFVRVINATTDKAAATIGGGPDTEIGIGEATPYAVVSDDTVPVTLGDRSADVPAADGSFVTVVVRPDGDPLVLVDEANENRGKAMITLYNLTDAPLSLKTEDGSIEVLEAVAPGASASRAVNPLSIGFKVYDGDSSVADVAKADLRGGKAYAVVVTENTSGPQARWVVASTGPTS